MSLSRTGNTNRLGTTTSDEGRENMSKARLGKVPWNKGLIGAQVAWNKGIVGVSDETRKKMSDAAMGRTPWNKGKEMPKETKEKLSNSLLGKAAWNKGLTNAQPPPWNKGRTDVYSEETLERMSELKLACRQARTIQTGAEEPLK